MLEHIVSKNLEKWKNNLLDKTRNNRLINYRLNRSSSLKFTEPMPEEIVDRLMNEKSWSIYLPPELDLPENHTPEEYEKWKKKWPKRKKTEVKIHHEERKRCRSSVRNLNRKDRSSTLNLGYNSLYLASGFLKWYPPELHKKEWRKSPLFISEAYIHIPKGDARPEIGLTQGFWTLNPTIKRILQSDYNVNLAKVKDEVELPNKEFDRILKAVKLVIPGRRFWMNW